MCVYTVSDSSYNAIHKLYTHTHTHTHTHSLTQNPLAVDVCMHVTDAEGERLIIPPGCVYKATRLDTLATITRLPPALVVQLTIRKNVILINIVY